MRVGRMRRHWKGNRSYGKSEQHTGGFAILARVNHHLVFLLERNEEKTNRLASLVFIGIQLEYGRLVSIEVLHFARIVGKIHHHDLGISRNSVEINRDEMIFLQE